ncbi:MAG: hypothetical protein AAF586_09050 [Planctomycetota bacterium]
MADADRARGAPPPLRCEGELRVDEPNGTLHVVGVEDGLEIRLVSLRQAWRLRHVADVLPTVEPLTGLMTWWRLSGVTLHLVVAGRRVAQAEPTEPADRKPGWLPVPWRARPLSLAMAFLAAIVGRG